MGFVVLVTGVGDGQPFRTEVRQTAATVPASTRMQAQDTSWSTLSVSQQQALAPLKSFWATMDRDGQERWLRMVDGFQAKSPQAQRRMQERMADWAQLTPLQRAQARLEYRQAASKFSPKQRRERWQAYRKLQPQQHQPALAASSLKAVPPASAQSEPGATTVLVTQLFGQPVTQDAVQADTVGDTQESPASGSESQHPDIPTAFDAQEEGGASASSTAQGTVSSVPAIEP